MQVVLGAFRLTRGALPREIAIHATRNDMRVSQCSLRAAM
jgi:hypothetical protein